MQGRLWCPICKEYQDEIVEKYLKAPQEIRKWNGECYELIETNFEGIEYESLCRKCGSKLRFGKEEKHQCSRNTVEWETKKDIPYYEVAGCGETLERQGVCKVCGRKFREVYLQSCIMDEDDETVDLTKEEEDE